MTLMFGSEKSVFSLQTRIKTCRKEVQGQLDHAAPRGKPDSR